MGVQNPVAEGSALRGGRVLPYCWECETPLSNFETRQDDAYRPREDPAVTVVFTLDADEGATSPAGISGPLRLLAWTTTPWTLPSNLALAVGPDVEYAVYEFLGAPTAIAAQRAEAYPELFGEAEPLARFPGSALVGRTYRPLFPFFAERPGAFRVLAGEFVATDEGTGVVHMAPGFGEEDFDLCSAAGIDVVCPVDDRGRFTSEVPPYAGRSCSTPTPRSSPTSKRRARWWRSKAYTHSYPHCWRTDTPLIYKAVRSWFVEVTAIKDRMLELNQQIDWIPSHIKDGAFGKWLEGARDWSISRNRFWGSPIPVWASDDPGHPRTDVYGSLEELERDFGVRLTDLHRPAIDELVRPNPDDPSGRSMMRRVTDVLDCWFESGSMPFAQVHYPFERSEWFEGHFPADFIVEYVSQTRGWFYTLHVLATTLFDRPPFRHCVAHGIVLGDDGRKMSKRLGNYPEPDMVFEVWGADAMRWFLLSSPILRGQDLVVHAKGIEDVRRQVLNPIWNAWYFLSLYANVDGILGRPRTDATGVLDRYILAKAASLVHDVTASMDGYDPFAACSAITRFLDALNNWYIRRSRDRFWRARDGSAEVESDKADAYDTLSTVLVTLCRVSAPLLPLLTETVHRGLTGERSVHLTSWPAAGELPADAELVEAMDIVRDVCSAAHAVRKANGRRARLPLRRLTVATARPERLRPFVDLIEDEVNVKEVVLTDEVGEVADEVLTLVHAALGPRLGPDTQRVTAAVRAGDWQRTQDGVIAGGVRLEPSEYELVLRPRNVVEGRTLPDDVGVVTLDTRVDDALESEGVAARRGATRPNRTAQRRPSRFGLHHLGDRGPGRDCGHTARPRALPRRTDVVRRGQGHGGRRTVHQGDQDTLSLTRGTSTAPRRRLDGEHSPAGAAGGLRTGPDGDERIPDGPAPRRATQRGPMAWGWALSPMGMTPWSGSAVGPSASTGRAPPVAALPWTGTAVMAEGSRPGLPPTGSGAAMVGMSSPGRGGVMLVGTSSSGRAVGRGAARCARREPAGCTCSSTQLSMSLKAPRSRLRSFSM